MNRKLGAKPPKIDLRDYRLASSATAQVFPDSFILDMGEVKDQGQVSSCVAHAAAEVNEYFNIKQDNLKEKMSVGYIYGTRYNYTGPGMYLRDALKTLQKNGNCTYKEFPYNDEVPDIINKVKNTTFNNLEVNKISTYFAVSTEQEIKKALYSYGPVMASIKWYDDITVVDGAITTTKKGPYGYHCIVLTGWNENGWIFMNSWGEDWGEEGYAILPYDFQISEAYGITDENIREKKDTEDVEIKVTDFGEIKELLIKLINLLINLLTKK